MPLSGEFIIINLKGRKSDAPEDSDRRQFREIPEEDDERTRNHTKPKVLAKVEHVLHVMKRQFGFTKVRYRGLDKNAHFLFVNCALFNLVMAKKRLLRNPQATCA
jgi:IS5 family transposase